jgi:hypothetical protein
MVPLAIMHALKFTSFGLFAAAALACGDSGTDTAGDMNPPQESVSDGTTTLKANIDISVEAGPGVFGLTDKDLADGWSVSYTKFLVTLGTFEFTDANGTVHPHQADAVVDLRQLVTAVAVADLEIPAGPTQVRFTMPIAADRFSAIGAVDGKDVEAMIASGASIYVEGAIENPNGHSCTTDETPVCTPAPRVDFKWGLSAGALLDDCADLAPDPDATFPLELVVRGDRWFHTDFRLAGAAAPTLRAQWLADADLDHDGEATLAELAAIRAVDHFDPADGYDLAGAPNRVLSARDFVEAQARTLARDALGCPTATPL